MTLVLGTRGSALALAQARAVASLLGGAVELRIVRTAGDVSHRPLRELGEGSFVTALEEALRRGEIDAAVHSLKDLPTDERAGLVVVAVPLREDARDVLITRARGGLATLPRGAVVGTGSPRRAAFLQALRPDVTTRDIRGNVETRMRKVGDGEYDAIVLALAGLRRLGVTIADNEILTLEQMPSAPGQGALAVQCRADDEEVRTRLATIDDPAHRAATDAERECLRRLGGSCDVALGAHATVEDGAVALEAALARAGVVDRVSERGANAGVVGRIVADRLRRGELSSVTVVLTREQGENAELAAELLARGAEVIEAPCVRTEPLADAAPLADAVRSLGIEDRLVVTSARGAEAVLRAVAPSEVRAPVFALGRASALPLLRAGIACATADAPTGEALGRAIPLPAGRILLARSDRAIGGLAEALRTRGARVEEVVAYRTLPAASEVLHRAGRSFRLGAPLVLVFASPSAVEGFAGAAPADEARHGAIVAIGPTTASRVRERLAREAVVAETPTLDGLLAAIRRCVEGIRHVSHA